MQDPALVGLRSGRRFSAGYVCYVGEDVTASDIVEALDCTADVEFVQTLNAFLEQMAQFKFDNVVSASWVDGRLYLDKVAERTVQEKREHPLP